MTCQFCFLDPSGECSECRMRRASSMFQMQMERYSKENMQSTLALFNQAQKRSGGSEMSRYANKFSSSSYNKNFGASFFAYQASTLVLAKVSLEQKVQLILEERMLEVVQVNILQRVEEKND